MTMSEDSTTLKVFDKLSSKLFRFCLYAMIIALAVSIAVLSQRIIVRGDEHRALLSERVNQREPIHAQPLDPAVVAPALAGSYFNLSPQGASGTCLYLRAANKRSEGNPPIGDLAIQSCTFPLGYNKWTLGYDYSAGTTAMVLAYGIEEKRLAYTRERP